MLNNLINLLAIFDVIVDSFSVIKDLFSKSEHYIIDNNYKILVNRINRLQTDKEHVALTKSLIVLFAYVTETDINIVIENILRDSSISEVDKNNYSNLLKS